MTQISGREYSDCHSEREITPRYDGQQGPFCPHYKKCSESNKARISTELIKGTWPYIGVGYGRARVSGHEIKLLFVAMERGGQFCPQKEPNFKETQRVFEDGISQPTNPHLGGTAQLIRHLVDEKSPASCAVQLALTNAVKCVWHT